jgi:hypothetical protein
MQGILRRSTPSHEGTCEVNSSTGNVLEDSFTYNTVATTVEESGVHNTSTGNEAEDHFSSNTAATTVEASNVPVSTNSALAYLEKCILKARNSLSLHTITLYSCYVVVSQKVLLVLPPRPSRVTFTTIKFYIHALILGDNPAVRLGTPLAMGKLADSVSLDLNEYERFRETRREKSDLIVPKMTRVDWLHEQGYTRSEMAEVEAEIKVIKMHRRRNARTGFWERVQEVFQHCNDRSPSVKRRRRSSYGLLIRASLSRKCASTSICCALCG